MAEVEIHFFVIAECDNHVGYLDRRVFNSYLNLLESTFAPADLDSIVIAFKIDVTPAQTFPTRCPSRISGRQQAERNDRQSDRASHKCLPFVLKVRPAQKNCL